MTQPISTAILCTRYPVDAAIAGTSATPPVSRRVITRTRALPAPEAVTTRAVALSVPQGATLGLPAPGDNDQWKLSSACT